MLSGQSMKSQIVTDLKSSIESNQNIKNKNKQKHYNSKEFVLNF